MTATTRTPAIGDAVYCDGLLHQLTALRWRVSSETGERLQACSFENARYRHYGLVRELRWSDELNAWYLWGRCLTPAQTATVITLRDRRALVCRPGRQAGHAPAGGEHLDLYLALFHGQSPAVWEQEVGAVVIGGALSPAGQALADAFKRRWLGPHGDGYADPDEPPTTPPAEAS